MSFKVITVTELSDERIRDILVTAFEGGSNHWVDVFEYINPDKIEVENNIYDLPFIEGCGVVVCDAEDITEKGILNRESIKKGLKIMTDRFSWHLEDIIKGNEDANTADVLLQCAVWGDIVFG